MGRPEDRREILRRDCHVCSGNGYILNQYGEAVCEQCGGSGMIEKTVDYKYDGERTEEEVDDIFKS
jgi:DnaJ-class molecular chaperone